MFNLYLYSECLTQFGFFYVTFLCYMFLSYDVFVATVKSLYSTLFLVFISNARFCEIAFNTILSLGMESKMQLPVCFVCL